MGKKEVSVFGNIVETKVESKTLLCELYEFQNKRDKIDFEKICALSFFMKIGDTHCCLDPFLLG